MAKGGGVSNADRGPEGHSNWLNTMSKAVKASRNSAEPTGTTSHYRPESTGADTINPEVLRRDTAKAYNPLSAEVAAIEGKNYNRSAGAMPEHLRNRSSSFGGRDAAENREQGRNQWKAKQASRPAQAQSTNGLQRAKPTATQTRNAGGK